MSISDLNHDLRVHDIIRSLAESGDGVCILDSCGVSYQDSRLMMAGVRPVDLLRLSGEAVEKTIRELGSALSGDLVAIFTISYDLGRRLLGIQHDGQNLPTDTEPDIYVALFDSMVIHDYQERRTRLTGNARKFRQIEEAIYSEPALFDTPVRHTAVTSNFTRIEYVRAVDEIKELIRDGHTYQTNLTQQITVEQSGDISAASVFASLRLSHPAAFSAFIDRGDSKVISASPERFFKLSDGFIEAAPVKGTRPRGRNDREDRILRNELLNSEKDRAENIMIVDLLRNDLGRVCEFGTVTVNDLCRIEEHSTLFHLVSGVSGKPRAKIVPSDIIRALFPCGSITGAPKIRTMEIIDRLEPSPRGLSMGAIGCYVPEGFGIKPRLETSVAIRTMVIRGSKAVFNVGGGVVIDSDPAAEYDESLVKARALLNALGASTADLSVA